MDKEQVIELVRAYIGFLRERGYSISSAWLFGSYARGNFHEDSDIDLAIFMDDIDNTFLMQVELMKLVRNFDSRIEPHPIPANDLDDSTIATEAMRYGMKVA